MNSLIPLKPSASFGSMPLQVISIPLENQPELASDIPLSQLSNHHLVIRCQNPNQKDRPAFEELVNRYQRYVDKLLYHLASDWPDRADLAQEVWIRVYRSIHRLKEPAKFKGWLGRITTNLFYDELRKRKRF